MKRSRFSEEQIAYALRQVEAGTPPADVCRQLGVGESTFYLWKKKYAHLGVTELRRLRLLEAFNGRLRDECLNVHQFTSIEDAKAKIEAWRIDYNRHRPHSSLGHLTPEEFHRRRQAQPTPETVADSPLELSR
jgi:putative transposase